MSAAELRRAAEALRGRADNATSGPWEGRHGSVTSELFVIAEARSFKPHSDMAYIATMHPGVGLALADWLDERAEDYVGKADECLRVARLINGT